jgi:hypothetical protein
VSFDQLFDYVRAIKNLLRWFIQRFLEANGHDVLHATTTIAGYDRIAGEHSRTYRLQRQSSVSRFGQKHLSLLILCYLQSIFLGGETSQEPLKHLIFDLSFPELVLRMLSRPCTAPLVLSFVQDLHNSIVSLQGAARIVLNTQIAWDAPAASSSSSAAPKSGTITFQYWEPSTHFEWVKNLSLLGVIPV